LLLNFVPQILNLVEQSFLFFALLLELFLDLAHLSILGTCRYGTLEGLSHGSGASSSCSAAELTHPVAIIVGNATACLE
jgi:hypothetical protein